MPSTTPSILDILTHTPLWVWAVFAVVIFLGFTRTRDRTVSLWRLLLMPVALVVVSLSGLMGAGLAALPAILVGFAIGGVAGWLLERDGASRRVAGGRLWLRGEWISLLQVLVILVFRYCTSVASILNPTLATDPAWHLVTAFVSSLLGALFVGRTAARLRVYVTAAPVPT